MAVETWQNADRCGARGRERERGMEGEGRKGEWREGRGEGNGGRGEVNGRREKERRETVTRLMGDTAIQRAK